MHTGLIGSELHGQSITGNWARQIDRVSRPTVTYQYFNGRRLGVVFKVYMSWTPTKLFSTKHVFCQIPFPSCPV